MCEYFGAVVLAKALVRILRVEREGDAMSVKALHQRNLAPVASASCAP